MRGRPSDERRGDEDQEDLGEDQVHDEQEDPCYDDRLVDGLADPGGPSAHREALVGGDDRGEHAEHDSLELRLDDVLGLGEGRERVEEAAGGTVQHGDVRQVAGDDAGHGDDPVEQHRYDDHGEHPGGDEPLHLVYAHHLHGGDLVADGPGAEVGAHSRSAGPGEDDGHYHRRRLAHRADRVDGADERGGTYL